MKLPILLFATALFACGSPASRTASTPAANASYTNQLTSPSSAMTLFDFNDSDSSPWSIQNDGVMGGKSKGTFEIAGGHLKFNGTTVTRGGGFSSVLAETSPNLSDYTGLEIRVRGSGRDFELAISDGLTSRGREVWRQKAFPTTSEWQTVKVAFDELEPSAHGEPVEVPALNKTGIELIGFYIIDGKDGAFELEVDWVKGY